MRKAVGATLACLVATLVAGCFDVQAPDLFMLTRTGQGRPLTMLVNDSGTIRCNGGATKPLPDPLLIDARNLADTLNSDATKALKLPRTSDSVYSYSVTLQGGTISFPDTAGAKYPELAQMEAFVIAAAPVCGISA